MTCYVIISYLILGFVISLCTEAFYKANQEKYDAGGVRLFLPFMWLPITVILLLYVIILKVEKLYSVVTDFLAKKLIEKAKK